MFPCCLLLVTLSITGMVSSSGTVFSNPDSLIKRNLKNEPAATERLLKAYNNLPPVIPPSWKNLEAVWSFALGDPAEGLNTTLASLPHNLELVTLPHRTLHADTPYWYVTEVGIKSASVLEFDADDGAQLYADGRRIPISGDVFYVPASSGKSHLVVRVLNKALYGGLGAARIALKTDYDRFTRQSGYRSRLSAMVRKTRLLMAPTSEQVGSALQAVQKQSEESLRIAERLLSGFPITIVGPYLQNAAIDQMRIVWETDVPASESFLEWGLRDSLTHKSSALNSGNLHEVPLNGLKPDTSYFYRIHSGPVVSPAYSFRTLPQSGPFAFTAWSDSHANEEEHGNNDVYRQNINVMHRLPIAFTVGAGDLVENGNHKGSWENFFEVAAPLVSEIPIMLVGGNHDYDGCFEDLKSVYFERYARNIPKPQYFAWTAGNSRFAALDPNMYFPTGIPVGSAEYKWLMSELESPEWKKATWHFIFLHQPPYSQGWADYHGDIPIRDLFDPLVEKYGIDFIVAGHTHDYEHLTKTYGSQKLHLLIVGGMGGGLEDDTMSTEPVMDKVIKRHHFGLFQVDGRKVTFSAVATDTRILDRFVDVK